MKKNIYELKPHPRNQEFFDDIEGEKWDEFLESISHGVIEPLIITQDDVIVSGHQRVRALKEIGKKETVNCIVKEYEDEDAVLRDLIESNIRQRGDIGGSVEKIGRRIEELRRIRGIVSGRHASSAETAGETMASLANDLGMSETSLRNYIRFAHAIPEITEAVNSGVIGKETALAIMRQLTEEQQIELISGLEAGKKYTERETAELIAEIQELKDRPAEVIETVIEKVPDDYDDIIDELDRATNTIEGMKTDYAIIREDLEERTYERDELRDELDAIKKADTGNARKKHQIDTGAMFAARVNKFIEDVAGYIWLTDEVMELPEGDRITFIRSVKKIQDWANQMENNIRMKLEEE